MTSVRVGIDTGGTFTDLMAVDGDGRLLVEKTPSTPENPSLAIMRGLANLRENHGLEIGDFGSVMHGTTVALNALLQHRWSSLGLIVTEGYREILEVARQTVPGEWGSMYTWSKPPRVVPLENVVQITERRSASGETLAPLDEEQVREAARMFRRRGIHSVAIVFLHSYAFPEHEERAREIFLEEYPDCFLATSAETLREFREYERAVTTCLSAAMMPLVTSYVESLQSQLEEAGYDVSLLIMKSSGGLSGATQAARQPVNLVFSGPSGGVLGMAWLAQQLGEPRVLTCDMGGTSTDIAAIENGRPVLTTEGSVDVYPIKVPIIDQVSVGAGGGSIASFGTGGRLRVGPESAGAQPGPICYRRGGTDVTVTDANLVLGRVAGVLLGGAMELDVESARAGVQEIADRLGLGLDEAAAGIIEISVSHMAGAVREVSVRKGRDPREHTLFSFGGAGPLHAVELAQLLGIPRVIVPRDNGLGSCLGLLAAQIQEFAVRPYPAAQENADQAELVEIAYNDLEDQLRQAVLGQGVESENIALERSADLRYHGMMSELTVPVSAPAWNSGAVEQLVSDFHDTFLSTYGYSYAGEQEVEIVNLRVTALGGLHDLSIIDPAGAGGTDADARTGERSVYVDREVGRVSCPVYDRGLLRPGMTFDGPAVVDSYDSTVFVPSGWAGRVDDLRNLVLEPK